VELTGAGIEAGRQEAERLVAHALGLSRSELLLDPAVTVEAEDAGRIASLARRRMAGVPLQHLEGTVAFRDLVLVCDGRALIPRPETEQLVQEIVDWALGSRASRGVRRVARRDGQPPLESALDIGTGSGAIALSLLEESIVTRVSAVDVSSAALEQATENALRLGLGDRLDLRRTSSSPWATVRDDESFDVIVSNPPYVPDGDLESLPVEVRDHDPREALAGGPAGLDLLHEIALGAPAHLRPGGGLFLEVGSEQAGDVRVFLQESAAWESVRVVRDLAGLERFVIALT
jgi:release factor glutamine methyltransferase